MSKRKQLRQPVDGPRHARRSNEPHRVLPTSHHPSPLRPNRNLIVLTLVPALIAAIVFANTLQNGLVYDDPLALEVATQPTSTLLPHRYGLAYLTIKLEELLWSSPSGFHLTNLLLHASSSALVGLLAFRLARS